MRVSTDQGLNPVIRSGGMGVPGWFAEGIALLFVRRYKYCDPMQYVVLPVLEFFWTDAEGDSDHLEVKLVCAGQVCCNPKTIMGISQYCDAD